MVLNRVRETLEVALKGNGLSFIHQEAVGHSEAVSQGVSYLNQLARIKAVEVSIYTHQL